MKIVELIVENIGQYAGRHVFELDTNDIDKPARNLVIIQGHNGAGKSTLFDAMRLAFHGRLALGNRVTDQRYNEFILSKLHHESQGSKTQTVQSASVSVTFTWVEGGLSRDVNVHRHWLRNKLTIEESFDITLDGALLGIERSDYQDWLNERFSPGIASICFFDAERLEAGTSTAHQQYLAETLRKLLGLDLVERLQADLDIYSLRQGGVAKLQKLRDEMRSSEAILVELDIEWNRIALASAECSEREELLLEDLTAAERALVAHGGTYAARRELWSNELSKVEKEKETLEGEFRDLCAGLMPFALAPELCFSLKNSLTAESNQIRTGQAANLWQQLRAEVEAELESPETWRGVSVAASDRTQLINRFVSILGKYGATLDVPTIPIVHALTEQDHEAIDLWIAQAIYEIPAQIEHIGDRLRELAANQQNLESNLRSAPTDDALAKHVEVIETINIALSALRRETARHAEERGALQYRREEHRRRLSALTAQLDSAQLVERQMVLAVKCKLALRTYEEALTTQRVRELEQRLVANFNAICSKKQLLPASYIDPKDFSVHLHGVDGHPILLSDLSAGERQLYSLALLQAFRQVCNQDLPLLIDTPLARLDDAHRLSIVRAYFPSVSSQVLLFATDAELPPSVLSHFSADIARRFIVRYNEATQRTDVLLANDASQLVA